MSNEQLAMRVFVIAGSAAIRISRPLKTHNSKNGIVSAEAMPFSVPPIFPLVSISFLRYNRPK